MIGHGMRRVLVILGVVAAILFAMNEVGRMMTQPRYGSGPDSGQKFGYFKNADPNDPEMQKQYEALLEAEAQHNADPAPLKKPKQPEPAKAVSPVPKPAATNPTEPADVQVVLPATPQRNRLDPPPHRLDPFGRQSSFPSYYLPAQHQELTHTDLQKLKLGREYRALPTGVTQLDRHWNGEQLGMSLSSFLQRYRQDEPQPGWPYLMLSNSRNYEHRMMFPWNSLSGRHWHLKAGIVLARLVLPEDSSLYREHLRSPELPWFDERLYCFLDEKLCLIRYITPRNVTRQGIYPDPGKVYCCELETPAEYAELFDLPRENIRRWGNGEQEILHIRGAYLGDQDIILHRNVKLCAELEASRLAAEQK